MCIVLATTAHPSYALIIIDNRDEFILRPTSRPHWWSSQHQEILSARDLQRAEQGTWLGITKSGNFAVLTNYREEDSHDKDHPIQGTRSRGGMVTAWLTSPREESTVDFVHRLLSGEGVKGVGGFSLLCGKLRMRHGSGGGRGMGELEPVAIISNRSGTADEVPWIAERRGEVYGLSNSSYADPIAWPKIEMGKKKLLEAVERVVENGEGEEELVEKLYSVLDIDTLPEQNGESFEEYLYQLRKSIFIPLIGKSSPASPMPKAEDIAAAGGAKTQTTIDNTKDLKATQRPDAATPSDMTGIYGTQRQTVILVDWEGKVSFRERALWTSDGEPIPRGKGDVKFEFQIDGWYGEGRELGGSMQSHI